MRRLADSAYLEATRLVAIGGATAGVGRDVVLIGLLVMMQTSDLTGGLISLLIGSITATVGMIILFVGRVARLAAGLHRRQLSETPVIKAPSQVPDFARATPKAQGSVLFRF